MRKTMMLAGLALALAVGSGRLSAGEIKGKVKSVDGDKKTVTVLVGDAEKTLPLAVDAKIVAHFGKKPKKANLREIPAGLEGVKEGANVTLSTELQGEKEVVTQLMVDDLQAKVKGKKKKNK
jgi:Cu/Ag efflux protein CusF